VRNRVLGDEIFEHTGPRWWLRNGFIGDNMGAAKNRADELSGPCSTPQIPAYRCLVSLSQNVLLPLSAQTSRTPSAACNRTPIRATTPTK
jgi:hypothetical protein